MLRRCAALMIGALIASMLAMAVRVPAARAGTVTSIGGASIGQITVDEAHGHVFLSRPSADAIEVYDFHGILVTTLTGKHAPTGMVLDGSALYVAENTAGAIEKIDTQNLTDLGAVATGLPYTSRLAFAGGRLWTAINGSSGWAALASVSTSGTVTTFGSYYDPDFATSPGAPDVLFMAEDGLSPGAIHKFDVSGATPTQIAVNPFTDQENIRDLAVSPDGSRVIPASGWPYKFEELSASSLAADGIVYPGDAYPSAVAVSSGHQGIVATGLDYGAPDVRLYRLGDPTPLFTATTSDAGHASIVPHGLAMSADGETLFAVSGTIGASVHSLNVYHPFGQTTMSIASSLNPSTPGQAVTFTITVAGAAGSGTPTGTVALLDNGAPLASVTLTAGSATFSTNALRQGTHAITGVYGGDDHHDGSSGYLAQSVTPFHATTSITSSPNPATTAQPITFNVSVTPDPGTGTPTGTVEISDESGVLGDLALGFGPLTLTRTLPGGVHNVTALYRGDAVFGPSASSVSQAVTPFPTTTSLTPSTNPSSFGQPVTFRAVVAPTAGGGAPSGTVSFADGQTVFDTEPLSNGQASVTTSGLALGDHVVKATYSGTEVFAPSTSSFVQSVVPPPPDPNGTFFPLPPARILDTRTVHSPVGPNKSIDVQATGRGGVPATGVSAVIVNLTATQPTAGSYLTAFPTGAAVPLASNLSFGPGQTIPNLVVVKLGSGGKFSVYNAQGDTHVIADVVGWYSDGTTAAGDRFHALPPARILDTRATHSPVGPNKSIDVPAAGFGGVPVAGVSAVVVNITVTAPTAGSYVTAFPTGSEVPLASNLNFGAGQTMPNLAVVKLGTDGKFSLYNAWGTTDLVADVVGWYSDDPAAPGASYTPLPPARILDTRTTQSPIGPNATIDVQAAGVGGLPTTGVSAVVVNLTVTAPTAGSYLTALPAGAVPPVASNLNFGPGQTIANLVVVKLGPGGKFSVYNAQGYTHVIADVVGWYSG